MEKYSVKQEPSDGEKTSSDVETCPVPGCEEVVEVHGNVRKCPVHGTEPWEPRK